MSSSDEPASQTAALTARQFLPPFSCCLAEPLVFCVCKSGEDFSRLPVFEGRKGNIVELEGRVVRRKLSLGQPHLGMQDQVVHRAGHGAVQGLGEFDCAASWGNETLVDELQPVVLHELTQGAQGPLDEVAVAGNASTVEDRRVKRGRVREDHELPAFSREDVPRPVGKGIWIERQNL